ncbi:MAG: phosphoglucosamine mutase [Clostridia bacterium]|nr:phosphoglucosamine mutase [Clostridia bacterium]
MARLFGTDGIRGIANEELTPTLAYLVGKAATFVLSKEQSVQPLFFIAKDPRVSGDMLQSAITAGILSQGGSVIPAGVLPTPAVAHLLRSYHATAGIMISASHNPMEYNGIKIFDAKGFKLPDETEDEIEKIVRNPETLPNVTPDAIGTIFPAKNAERDYINFLKSTVNCNFKGLKIALDCANGATSSVAESVFSELGATIFPVSNQPDGKNINQNCGSTHPEHICHYTVKCGCDVGISFDGDGDRVLFSDELGNTVDGDQILAILSKNMQKNGTLQKNTAVSTVMSNFGLTLFGEANNINIVQANVGDRYVLEKMLKNGYNLGGEQSGHIIISDHNTTGDGILTALKTVEIMVSENKKMSELSKVFDKLPQVLVNARVQNKNKDLVLKDEAILELVENVSIRLFKKGRALVRPSGTEPLFHVMIEGENLAQIQQYADEIAQKIEEKYS